MNGLRMIDLGEPGVLVFRGPDAVRFLNGQVTQDVRRLAGGQSALPACVTDAKGRLQFRVWITEGPDGALWVETAAEEVDEVEARLTRYLIADDVEVGRPAGQWRLVHFTGPAGAPGGGGFSRASGRFGIEGTDWWLPAGQALPMPDGAELLAGEEFEAWRIGRGIPAWGRELEAGLLPPEAGLDATDVSYQKGCYIGQEVISRIKSAGKVNQRLARLEMDAGWQEPELVDEAGKAAGRITSVSPVAVRGRRAALAFVKRGAGPLWVRERGGGGNNQPERVDASWC